MTTDDRPYADDDEHLADELRRLDLLLADRTTRFRRELSGATTGGALYVGHDEVDRLLARDRSPGSQDGHHEPAPAAELRAHITRRVRASAAAGVALALPRLAARFALTDLECDIVLICLGPELDPGYDRLYAYLQDDVTRRRPSLALVLDLLVGAGSRREIRRLLAPDARLRRHELLRGLDDAVSPSGDSALSRMLRLDERVLGELLGGATSDERLDGLVARAVPAHASELDGLAPPDAVTDGLTRLLTAASTESDCPALVVHLVGPPGVGRREAAALACARMGSHLLVVDVPGLLARDPDPRRLLRLAAREARFEDATLYLDDADALVAADAAPRRRALAAVAADAATPVLLSGSTAPAWSPELRGIRLHTLRLPEPGPAERGAVWKERLADGSCPAVAPDELGTRFRLTVPRIRHAVADARLAARARGDGEPVTADDLVDAARRQVRNRYDDLAVRVTPRADWSDLVLPADQEAQLREIADQVRHADEVLDRWGFARGGRTGRAVTALFAGPPGTGKTLAAEVLAGDLGLDLCAVDLSAVVSKYIGETEKNLARVFDRAEGGHEVLFFDEADALFGRRTSVTDAHDRYANLETGYLLRRMEDFTGIAVLATNLRENMDDAFTRRLRAVVEFPFPDEAGRRAIWARHLPEHAPIATEVDLDLLAREVLVAGGHIRTIVLNAAFLAAGDGRTLRMRHVWQATRREFGKIGKPWEGLAPVAAATGGRRG